MTQANKMTEWLDDLIRAAKDDRIISTSAGAGPERNYAYLHFRCEQTDGEDEHSVLVFRHTQPRTAASVIAFRFEGDDEEIAEHVARATSA